MYIKKTKATVLPHTVAKYKKRKEKDLVSVYSMANINLETLKVAKSVSLVHVLEIYVRK